MLSPVSSNLSPLLVTTSPNAETLEAIKAAETGNVVGPFKTVDDLLQDLNADD